MAWHWRRNRLRLRGKWRGLSPIATVRKYLDRAVMWPCAHGGACPDCGAAIVTQSGMLSSDITMS